MLSFHLTAHLTIISSDFMYVTFYIKQYHLNLIQ